MSFKFTFVTLLYSIVFISVLFSATFTVTNAGDAGAGSLREAINLANATPGFDVIEFAIPGAGVKTITLGNRLPNIIDPVFIDGASDPAYAGNPLIEINVNGFLQGLNVTVTAPGTQIHGLIINNAQTNGILVQGNQVKITGCYLGTNAAGNLAAPNAYAGIEAQNATQLEVGGIGVNEGNLISGNGSYGVRMLFSSNSSIVGNQIGTDITGTAAVPNGIGVFDGAGVNLLLSDQVTIGGATVAHKNLISGNLVGIYLVGELSTVYGNYIGTDASGSNPLPNQSHGVVIVGNDNQIGGNGLGQGNLISGNDVSGINITSAFSFQNQVIGNLIGTDVLGTATLANGNHGIEIAGGARRNTIGSLTGAGRNLISGNINAGIDINDADSNLVHNNYIGTDINGTLPLGNGSHGIAITSALFNSVGNATAAGVNVISGNGESGILITGIGADRTLVKQNLIGTDNTGVAPMANAGRGIFISAGATLSEIGGLLADEGNIIANNLQGGIEVNGVSTLQNQILRNSIFDHPVEGIRLTGGNINQSPPVITGFTGVGPSNIFGTFNSAPNTTYRIEFFTSASANQGKTYLGFATITTDGTGAYALNEIVAATIGAMEPVLSATATDPNGNTSPFAIESVLNSEILSLEAQELPAYVAGLSWETIENQQNIHFEIEQRNAAGTFDKIGEQHLFQSQGATRAYRFQTQSLLPGRYQFRVLMIGQNGQRTYSKSVELHMEGKAALEVLMENPFPAQAKLGIVLQETQEIEIRLMDSRGKHIAQIFKGALQAHQLHEFPLEQSVQLSRGMYLLHIQGTSVQGVRKVMRQ